MLQVGITGGIGSGKTTVCKIFEILNIPIYYADDQAKKLMVTNELLIQDIKDFLGPDAYTKEGQLNRPYIANIVFNDQSKLDRLNSLVHPMDKTILVVAPLEIRIKRVIDRDTTSKEAVLARISKQMPDEEKIPLADYIILNNGKAPLVPQILKIHDKLSMLSKKRLG